MTRLKYRAVTGREASRFQWDPDLHAAKSRAGVELGRVPLEARGVARYPQAAVRRPPGPDRVDRLRDRRHVTRMDEHGVAAGVDLEGLEACGQAVGRRDGDAGEVLERAVGTGVPADAVGVRPDLTGHPAQVRRESPPLLGDLRPGRRRVRLVQPGDEQSGPRSERGVPRPPLPRWLSFR